MRRDHRPNWLRQLQAAHARRYARRHVATGFDSLGPGLRTVEPWHIHLFGADIHAGAHLELRATRDAPIRLTTWQTETCRGSIRIGDHVLIGPGARLQSAHGITLGDNVMLAAHVLISDADWHDLHNRLSVPGRTGPVVLEDNSWIGDSAIICKGAHVGRNSVIGAGSVVLGEIPPNCVAAGNPAGVIRPLDPSQALVTRASLFRDPIGLDAEIAATYRDILRPNSFLGWLRSKLFPRIGD